MHKSIKFIHNVVKLLYILMYHACFVVIVNVSRMR